MKAKWIPALCAAALSLGFADEESKIEYKPLSVGALQEFGVLKSGRFGGATKNTKNEWTDHVGAFLTQEAVVDENLVIRVGLGGLFEFQKPEKISPNWGGTQYRNFFIGPTVADINYTHGMGSGTWSLGVGMFPFKYNPDAANLGEYLFRTGPYPGYIWSGGYAYVGDNQAYLQGLKARFAIGNFTADVLALTETGMAPLYDLSLGAVLKYRIADGLVDLTAGVKLNRIVPVHPSVTTRERPTNAYFTNAQGTWTGKIGYYDEQANFFRSKADTAGAEAQRAFARNNVQDSAFAQKRLVDSAAFQVRWQGRKDTADMVRAWVSDTATVKPDYQYYSQTGVVAMVAFSLDFKKFMTSEMFGPNDMRLFGEVALLGVKDYPIFYEKKTERMPMMVGFNLPGFRFFDLISVQAEFYNSPWVNSYEESGATNEATPAIPLGDDQLLSKSEWKDVTKNDNVYWSVLVRKELMAGLSATAQVARDHIRSVSESAFAGPGTDPNEILYSNKDWYWMLQFSFGI